jgi:hypothetical protein
MNVAIVHYHLDHGGVTQVIANQLRALECTCAREDHVRIALLCGGQTQGWPQDRGARLHAIDAIMGIAPRLRYDPDPVDESVELACQLREQLSAFGFPPDETILHVHNHSLGKNASLPGALRLLAEDGYALLLQIHDFAEDYRPRNYDLLADTWGCRDTSTILYPQAEHVHYAVLNRRDYAVLTRAGVPSDRLHHLPNPLVANGHLPDRHRARQHARTRFGMPANERFLLYPVRAIRRKNIGEALLWSVLGGPAVHVGVTLAPLNPAEQPYYQRWKQVAREMALQVHFEMGGARGLPLEENLASADLVLTSSVTEGFGMAFLESWVAERALVGRDLPEITADFAASGLRLDHLYQKLKVPIDLVGRTAFHAALQSSYSVMLASYRRPAPDEQELARMTAARSRGGIVDFADLDEQLQEQVLCAVQADRRLREIVLGMNPAVRRALETPHQMQALIMPNKLVACQEYSLAVSGTRLRQAYQKVMANPRGTRLSALSRGSSILDDFLAPDRFRPIRG